MATSTLHFTVQGLTCADCAMQLERAVKQVPDVRTISISVMTGTASVIATATGDDELQALADRLGGIATPLGFTMSRAAAAEDAIATFDVAEGESAVAAEVLRGIAGVRSVKCLAGGLHGRLAALSVAYDPKAVGARTLLVACGPESLVVCRHSALKERDEHVTRLAFAVSLTVITIVLQYGVPRGAGSYDAEFSGLLSPRVLLMWLLATIAAVVFGAPLVRNAAAAAWLSRTMTMDTLVSISSGVAYVYALALIFASWATGSTVQGWCSCEQVFQHRVCTCTTCGHFLGPQVLVNPHSSPLQSYLG